MTPYPAFPARPSPKKKSTGQDGVALRIVKFLRRCSDAYFGDRLLDRACMLETIAAVPGFVAGMIHHMSLWW